MQILRPSEQNGRIDLNHLLTLLAQQGYGEVMVEAGATLAGAFLEADLADEIVLYQAPKILGNSARGLFELKEHARVLNEESAWKIIQTENIGSDIKITLKK